MVQGRLSWWRRVRFGEPVVVVSGLPRSGTSMAMRMLEAGGVPHGGGRRSHAPTRTTPEATSRTSA